MAREAYEPKRWFCFFRVDAEPMAVSVESVAGVLETDRLVRLPWSPPQVVGLCSYHREAVPVVTLGSLEDKAADDRRKAQGTETALHSTETTHIDLGRSRWTVLVLRTDQGAWGISVKAGSAVMSQESPEHFAPRTDDRGGVLVGTVRFAGTSHGILDAEATWCGLRCAVVRWCGLLSGLEPAASVPSEAAPIAGGSDSQRGQFCDD
jgi:chemotaxis signal transduction protein